MSLNISEVCHKVIYPNYNVILLFTISVLTHLFSQGDLKWTIVKKENKENLKLHWFK